MEKQVSAAETPSKAQSSFINHASLSEEAVPKYSTCFQLTGCIPGLNKEVNFK